MMKRKIHSIDTNLSDLGLTLPTSPAAVAHYVPYILTGNLVITPFLIQMYLPPPTSIFFTLLFQRDCFFFFKEELF